MKTAAGGFAKSPDRTAWVTPIDPYSSLSRLISSHPVWAGILAVGMFLAGLSLPTLR